VEPRGDRDDPLAPYRAKRVFDRTPEPSGELPEESVGDDREARFVVQKHDARRLHYDFRLESSGVLVSWAVPKGPSYDPKAKRLAVHVEDHPLDYEGFEGVIPEAQYGAGTVIVWDRGVYHNLTEKRGRAISVEEAVRAGHLSIWLEGTKLRGGWSLTRTGGYGEGGDNWLLVKRADEHADPARDITVEASRSVKSGKDLAEMGSDVASATWTRERATWSAPLLDEPPESGVAGTRCIGVRNGHEIVLWTADHRRVTDRFPAVAEALAGLPADNFTVDGAITAAGEYLVFDLIHLLGRDTTVLPVEDRRVLLAKTVEGAGPGVRPV
jgi:DNA ligase D-like protein (predicted 3'-phosphoesterase)